MDYNLEIENLFYSMALMEVMQIGGQGFRLLVNELGSPKAVFKSPIKTLQKIEGIGHIKSTAIKSTIDEKKINDEIAFIQNNHIKVHFCFDNSYPHSLKQISDAPVLLFSKGNFDIHHPRKIAIVGTRNHSEYGKRITEKLVDELKPYQVQIVSGMAYGIDIIAHKQCVERQISTVGVLAHGLDRIYPSVHKATAKAMLENGGLLTEYHSGTNPDKFNFPMRNRIAAGMCDMTLVVESKQKGGALITAKLAASYDREVGAVPGKINDERSAGCNYLIKRNIGHLIEDAGDIAAILNWDEAEKQAAQSRLFLELSTEEQQIVDCLKAKESTHIDELMLKTNKSYSMLASILLNLELINIVKPMSGKRYRLI